MLQFPCEVIKGLFGISRENTSSGLPENFFDEKTSLAKEVFSSKKVEKVISLEVPKNPYDLPVK